MSVQISGLAALSGMSVSDAARHTNTTERSGISVSYVVNKKRTVVNEAISTCRLKVDIKTSDGGDSYQVRFIKGNDNANLDSVATTGADIDFVTVTCDTTVTNLVVGDTVGVKVKSVAGTATVTVKNFRICYDAANTPDILVNGQAGIRGPVVTNSDVT